MITEFPPTQLSKWQGQVKGFSLIELMIVISIIAVLSSIAVPKYQNYLLRATATTQFSAAIRPIQNALSEFVAYNGSFPTSLQELAQVGFVNHRGQAYTTAQDFAVGAVSGVNITFPTEQQDELIMAVAFNCDGSESSACGKVAPKKLRDLSLEVSAKYNAQRGTLSYLIDSSRQANLAFQGFLPRL